MRNLLYLLAIVAFAAGCHKNKAEQCPSTSTQSNYKDSARVDYVPLPLIGPPVAFVQPGSKKVFIYQWSTAQCQVMADGVTSGRLLFEIDPSVNDFKYYADTLPKVNCYYKRNFGDGSSSGDYTPTGGVIEGSRINDHQWRVSVDVKTHDGTPLTFSAVFEKIH